MHRFFGIVLFSFTLADTTQCQALTTAPTSLDSAQKKLLSKMTAEWKAYFRSISTLDMQWQSSGYPLGPDNRQTYKYHFLREPHRNRLNTRYYSQKLTPRSIRYSVVLGEGGATKTMHVARTGQSRLFAPYFVGQRSPYGIYLPVLAVFGWATDSESMLTLEEFSRDEFWLRFERRVKSIEAGSWRKRRGWWLTATAQLKDDNLNERTVRFFVEGTTFFPFLTLGRIHFKSKESVTDGAYEVRVTKTQAWVVNGKTRLLPLDTITGGWRHNLTTNKWTSGTDRHKALAPIKINGDIASTKWKLTIPDKTLVTYALRPYSKTKGEDLRTFHYDPQGGSLWAQQEKERQRAASGSTKPPS
jgi:hypothetical protein